MERKLYLIHKGNVNAVQSLLDKALDIADKFIMEYSYTEHHIHTKNCDSNDPDETESRYFCSSCGQNINVKIKWQTIFILPASTVSDIFKKKDRLFRNLRSRILDLENLVTFMCIFSGCALIFIFIVHASNFERPISDSLFYTLLSILMIFDILLYYICKLSLRKKIGKYAWLGKFDKKKKRMNNLVNLPDILFRQIPIEFYVVSDDNHLITTDINQVILPNSTIWSGKKEFYWDETLPFNKFITNKYLNSVENIFESI